MAPANLEAALSAVLQLVAVRCTSLGWCTTHEECNLDPDCATDPVMLVRLVQSCDSLQLHVIALTALRCSGLKQSVSCVGQDA